MSPIEFYPTLCGCRNTEKQCPGIRNSNETGWIPRGFFTEDNPSKIEIMGVCKNPGHLINGEAELYKNRPGIEIARIHLNFAKSTFNGLLDSIPGARRSTTFHKNLIRYLSYFLDVPKAEVFNHAVYTNLVKCSTHGERDVLNGVTMHNCFSQHLLREINYFQPKVLIAFGREVENFLLNAKVHGRIALPIIYVKHPSYFYKREEESYELEMIKNRIIEFIK